MKNTINVDYYLIFNTWSTSVFYEIEMKGIHNIQKHTKKEMGFMNIYNIFNVFNETHRFRNNMVLH
jgi:hypothetical protein